jgi:exodeoxyribonuclease VIII
MNTKVSARWRWTDNSYVQNLLLAAENCEQVGLRHKDLWRYTDAIRKVFSQEKRPELALFSDSPESGRRLITLTAACW